MKFFILLFVISFISYKLNGQVTTTTIATSATTTGTTASATTVSGTTSGETLVSTAAAAPSAPTFQVNQFIVYILGFVTFFINFGILKFYLV